MVNVPPTGPEYMTSSDIYATITERKLSGRTRIRTRVIGLEGRGDIQTTLYALEPAVRTAHDELHYAHEIQ